MGVPVRRRAGLTRPDTHRRRLETVDTVDTASPRLAQARASSASGSAPSSACGAWRFHARAGQASACWGMMPLLQFQL